MKKLILCLMLLGSIAHADPAIGSGGMMVTRSAELARAYLGGSDWVGYCIQKPASWSPAGYAQICEVHSPTNGVSFVRFGFAEQFGTGGSMWVIGCGEVPGVCSAWPQIYEWPALDDAKSWWATAAMTYDYDHNGANRECPRRGCGIIIPTDAQTGAANCDPTHTMCLMQGWHILGLLGLDVDCGWYMGPGFDGVKCSLFAGQTTIGSCIWALDTNGNIVPDDVGDIIECRIVGGTSTP